MAEAPGDDQATDWAGLIRSLQALWQDASAGQPGGPSDPPFYTDPANLAAMAQSLMRALPQLSDAHGKALWEEGFQLAGTILGQYGIGPQASDGQARPGDMPRSDPRFADPAWRRTPLFALMHQAYLMLSERLPELVAGNPSLEPRRKDQLLFAVRILIDALSPANFPLTNPVAIDRAAKTGGQSLIKGMEQLLADLTRGQLTHSDPHAFTVGANIATTPGKVVHQTRLYQLIQYAPVTDRVLGVPLVIFPAWINRFYILDLVERKSFVRWALEQGISVFMVSWKSADESLADVGWDDYIAAQIEAVELVCERLGVPAVHVLGYCVAGTMLAAALGVLARRGDASIVQSATFLTAQVDFSEPGDLGHFTNDAMIAAIDRLGQRGFVDGRYLAATFNLLRGRELIWSQVERSYLLGDDPSAFDLLHWNGDTTNLPVRWMQDYLRNLYSDNLLVEPDALSACGVPIDLGRIVTPSFIHAAREDHIAPPGSVWKLMHHLSGVRHFVLAASGHIAGVVNPPAAAKYRYWTGDDLALTLDEFIASAVEHKGSWWPHWVAWLHTQDSTEVAASGKRMPGGRGDRVIEDAPGSYVSAR